MSRHHRDQVQIGIGRQRRGEQPRNLFGPQILVLQIDQPPGAQHGLGVAASDAAFTAWGEVVFEVRVGVGTQHLDGLGPARRGIRWPAGQRIRAQVAAAQLVGDPGDRREHVQRRRVGPALPEREVEGAHRGAPDLQLRIVPRWVVAVLPAHGYGLRVATMPGVVPARMAQIDTAREGDVPLG